MKKIFGKALLVTTIIASMVITMTGCKKEKDGVVGVTLGEYKGIKVSESAATITEEELNSSIKALCEAFKYDKEVTEGTTTKTSVIKVDYTSTIDGAEYTNSSGTGTEVDLSSTLFKATGVIEALIDKKVGEVVEVDAKYADDNTDTTIAGKTAHFVVTIKCIVEEITPEFNDAFVAENFAYRGYTTTAQLTEYLKRDLFVGNVMTEIWQKVIDNATAIGYDKDDLKEMTDQYVDYQEYIIYSYTGYTLTQYLAAVSQTEDEFRASMEEEAKADLKNNMVVEAIAKAEGITIANDEEYNKLMKELAGDYGYDTVEEFSTAYAETTKDDFMVVLLTRKVQELVADSAIKTPDAELGITTEAPTTEAPTTGENETTTEAETTPAA